MYKLAKANDNAVINNSNYNDTSGSDDNVSSEDSDDNDDLAGAGGAAALVGAPIAFGLMFGRRRVSGKHAKIK